jgi:hypothetical protein
MLETLQVITNVLLVIATLMIAYATYLMYTATRKVTLLAHKPVVIAWLREPEKGRGIYVQSIGNGTAFNGTVVCRTASGEARYEFTRLWVGQRYEHPIAGQPSLVIGPNDREMEVIMNYQDIDGNKYDNRITIDLFSQVELTQV